VWNREVLCHETDFPEFVFFELRYLGGTLLVLLSATVGGHGADDGVVALLG